MRAYLDHASVSPLRPAVIEALHQVLEIAQADPGRPYEEALAIRDLIEQAREEVATLVGATARQVVFTSSIAESITTSISALAEGGPIIHARTERSAVEASAARYGTFLELSVDCEGHLDLAHLEQLLTEHPGALVCCQIANHETGVLTDVGEVVTATRRYGGRIHVDASVAFGHLAVDAAAIDADAITVSSELIGGPLGAAGLIVRRGHVLRPLLLGGAQERARRSGLEGVLALVGFGVAAGVLNEPGAVAEEAAIAQGQIEQLEAVATAVTGVATVGDPRSSQRAPQLRCFTIEGVEAEPVLLGLDRRGISVHSGSACSAESLLPSPVLAAMGLDADRSLRLSVGHSTTEEDIRRFTDSFAPVVEDLRSLAS